MAGSPTNLGQQTSAKSVPVVLATDQSGISVNAGVAYETVAASQTDQVLGGAGAAGDFLAGLLIVPATNVAGAVSIKDGSGASIMVFSGAVSLPLASLIPFPIPIGAKSVNGAWKVTTGANVSLLATGTFT